MLPRRQLPHMQLNEMLGHGVRTGRPRCPLALLFGGAALAAAMVELLGIEPHPTHQGCIAAQQGWQRIDALAAQQALQSVAPSYCTQGTISRRRAVPWMPNGNPMTSMASRK